MIENAEVARASYDRIEKESHQQDALDRTPTVLFFTDSSGYKGQVGALAVTPRVGVFRRRYLRTTEESTVYVTELNGIEMAIARFVNQQHNRRPTKMVIFSDSQAAIQAVQNPKRSSGQYVLTSIYDHVRALRSQTPKQQLQRRIEFLKYLKNHASWQLLVNGSFNLTPCAII